MHRRRLVFIVGAVVAAAGASMLVPAAVAMAVGESGDARALIVSAAISMASGLLAWKVLGRPGDLSSREGFAAVGLAWFAVTAFGSLPYILSGAVDGFTNAFFETTSGFTTTGATVLTDPAALGRGMLLWRAQTQWMGGMGIIVLGVAILPLLGVGGVQLFLAESPGPTADRFTPRFRETAKRLWVLYLAFTAVEAVLLAFGDMSIFEAVAHSLTTMATGGFSTRAGSLGAFSAYSQWVVVVFMALAGTSFALHFRGLRDPRHYARHGEFRIYLLVLGVASAIAIVGTWGGPVARAIREAVFSVVSLATSTGYTVTDWVQWSAGMHVLVALLMFVGGMVGSTAGGIKSFRLGVLASSTRNDLRRVVHPHGVFITRLGKDPVPDRVVQGVQAFLALYLLLFAVGTLVMAFIAYHAGDAYDLTTVASSVASALGNIGPALGDVGPVESFAGIPTVGKWLLSFLMIVGRLEIFPVVLLLTRELWRK
jgi:trk system potassium uptake protein TrkH